MFARLLWFNLIQYFIHCFHLTYSHSSIYHYFVSDTSLFSLICFFDPPLSFSDPEQSAHELVYDLRSQSDAIRVTKTVRPYRMVICPVNENSAALMVGDGRVMLWELKAHSSRAATIPG